ncbi:MAG: ComEC/Rec2 family competence protein [Actinomycetota bacterium]|nr:ComEC/Rec2 family competence protein [Actinomycetota bacterium]
MKYCYFIWALAVTAGVLFLSLCICANHKISIIMIAFLLFVSLLISVAGIFYEKKYLSTNKANALFLAFTIILFFLIGFISSCLNFLNNTGLNNLLSNNNVFKNKNIELIAFGKIVSNPFRKFNKIYFDLKMSKIKVIQKDNGSFQELNCCGKIFVSCKTEDEVDLNFDDLIKMNLTGAHLLTGNSGNSSHIFYAEKIMAFSDKSFKSYFSKLNKKLHCCINLLFNKNLNTINSKIASALVLGNQTKVPKNIVMSFKESGIYHLLAISGLHISIIASFAYFIFKKINFLLCSKKINISNFIFLFLVSYNFIIGIKASMIRASVMFCLALFAKDIHRDFLVSNSFFTAYIILLLICPDYISNPGFILSFASIAAIIFIVPVIKKTMNYFLNSKKLTENYMMKSIITAVSVSMITSPILSYFFGGFSIISVFTNIAVAPLFYLLLMDLVISSAFSVFWFSLGSFFIAPADILTDTILKISDFFASLPYSFIKTDIFNGKVVIVLYYSGFAALFFSLNYLIKRKESIINIKNNV